MVGRTEVIGAPDLPTTALVRPDGVIAGVGLTADDVDDHLVRIGAPDRREDARTPRSIDSTCTSVSSTRGIVEPARLLRVNRPGKEWS